MTGHIVLRVVTMGCLMVTRTILAEPGSETGEPNFEMAAGWWPEIENTWVPMGWKDHPLRFNVLYNGTLIAQPVRYPARGQGVQLTFELSMDGTVPTRTSTEPYQLRTRDGGVGEQGWTDDAAPVLWTRWRQDDAVVRQDVFAHVPGGGAIATGFEPLFAWIRLTREGSLPPGASVLVRINQPHIQTEMDRHKNLIANPAAAAYARPLRHAPASSRDGLLIVDDADQARLAVVAPESGAVQLIDQRPASPDAYLKIAMSELADGHVDLLVPLVPVDRGIADAELQVGRDAALHESNRYWSVVEPTAARVDTPESLVNAAARQAVRYCEVIAQRDPATGQYALLSGSWHYEALWSTPTSMNITMILDGLGHHRAAEKYLEIFRVEQGTIVPPGKAYRQHRGYFATPRSLTSVDWLTDHGAILYAVAHHGLVTDDRQFIERWTEPMLHACEFIRDFRTSTGHGGVEGILPAAVPTDAGVQEQSVWSDGWNYKGLSAAVRLLKRLGHPRADEFNREAVAYRDSFQRALRAAMPQMPTWTDSAGQLHRFVPTALPTGGDLKHPFYLDGGPLFLVYGGLMTADDELMRSTLHYFRAGPNTQTYDREGAWYQPVCLRHELSSCEPCYSWNVFHAWQAGDREKFLEGMYSLLSGSVSRRTSIGCEHRGGVSGTLFSLPLPIELVRLSVLDDQWEPDHLHLLRMVPQAWLRDDRSTSFDRMPTEFGPVTLQFQLDAGGRRLRVALSAAFRQRPRKILLHVPPREGLCEVMIGDQLHAVQPGDTLAIDVMSSLGDSGPPAHAAGLTQPDRTKPPVPRIEGAYIPIYQPTGDVFPGPDEVTLQAGQYYDQWVPNDHCFIKDDLGRWHLFGITHPLTPLDDVHAGENQSFHAVAPPGPLHEVLRPGAWCDQPKVLPPSERPGEPRANHAPCILRHGGQYLMVYGPTPIRSARSDDLFCWRVTGALAGAPEGRDPSVLLWNDRYHLAVCGRAEVRMALSKDLRSFSGERAILQMRENVDPESPSIIRHAGTFYLFVCGWDGIWDKRELDGAYQHVTHVYQSDDPWRFDANREIARLAAHAPEVIQAEDGRWYISSAEYPQRGVSVARLVWE